MIIVVEGISAAGKTSWCRAHGSGITIDEALPRQEPPSGIDAAARFWTAVNAQRWSAARAMQARAQVAVCDTDPLKLHYAWSLWRIGEVSLQRWQADCVATRAAIADGQLGFADIFLVKDVEPAVARRQRDGDRSRTRRNFELHALLGPPLADWYRSLGQILPGAVMWTHPQDGLASLRALKLPPRPSALEIFDTLMAILPAQTAG